MKLVLCIQCGDIFSLRINTRGCACGSSRGRYVDSNMVTAEISGSNSVVISFNDLDLRCAIDNQVTRGRAANEFAAYIAPKDIKTVKMVKYVS